MVAESFCANARLSMGCIQTLFSRPVNILGDIGIFLMITVKSLTCDLDMS